MARFASLTVGLNADSAQLRRGLGQGSREINRFEGSSQISFRNVARAATLVGAAVTVAVGAIVSLARAQTVAQRGVGALARTAGLTVTQFESVGFATEQYGIQLDNLGDILQDTRERVGDFIATGGGPFQDVADVLGVSADAALGLAEELQGLAGPQVLLRVVSEMEAAGASAEEMSFALEGLASNSTRLLPLLRNNGEELRRLQQRFDEINIPFTQTDIDNFAMLSVNFSLLDTATNNLGRQLSSSLSPVVNRIVSSITDLIVGVTNLVDNGFRNLRIAFNENRAAIAAVVVTIGAALLPALGSLILAIGGTLVRAVRAAVLAFRALALANPFGLIIAAGVLLGTTLVAVFDRIAIVGEALWDSFDTGTALAFTNITGGLLQLRLSFFELIRFVGTAFTSFFSETLEDAEDFINEVREYFGQEPIDLSFSGANDYLDDLVNGAQSALDANTSLIAQLEEQYDNIDVSGAFDDLFSPEAGQEVLGQFNDFFGSIFPEISIPDLEVPELISEEYLQMQQERFMRLVMTAQTSSQAIAAQFNAVPMAAIGLLGNLQNLIQTVAGESQAAFLLGQAAAVGNVFLQSAQARASAVAAAAGAAASAGPAAPAVFASTLGTLNGIISANQAISLATIAAQTLQGLQTGGFVNRGGNFLVGERGPEIVSLPAGSAVVDNERTDSLIGGGGRAIYENVVVNTDIGFGRNSQATSDAVSRGVLNSIRQGELDTRGSSQIRSRRRP